MASPLARRRAARTVSLAVVPALAVALVATVSPASAATGTATTSARPGGAVRASVPAAHDGPTRVTLITGDVVTVTPRGDGRTTTEIARPLGATGGVHADTVNGHLMVVPDEALPYLASGRVDRRLFDITTLVAMGYDDSSRASIPLIVRYAGAAKQIAATTRTRTLESIGGAAVRASKKRARTVWTSLTPARSRATGRTTTTTRTAAAAGVEAADSPLLGSGVESVWLDGRVRTQLAESTAQIGAAAAWASNLDGTGVKVAVLDTGYDTAHPDLAGRVSLSKSFVPGEGIQDANTHGTHTASTVGGSGAASDGAEKGVAYGADLLVGKVLGDSGYGEDSWVIAGMEWAADNGARVVSLSLSGDTPNNGTEPMCAAVDSISQSTGALFVVAAGNNGNEATMSCPSAADSALTVAAVDAADELASFSSRGPRFGDYGLKPDIAAPGVDILAAKAGGDASSGWYTTMSGTSMATPHVAGAAAILFQQHPSWTGAQVKDALMSTAKQVSASTYEVGAGRVDLSAATTTAVTATGSAYFGFVAWPHPDPAPVQRTITYRNSSSSPVTLDLSEAVAITGGAYDVDPGADNGTPAPEGMFTLSTDRVTVPADGTATVTATAKPALGQSARRYTGQIVARDGDAVVARTQVGLYEEEERYTVTVKVRDRAGAPVATSLQMQKLGVPDTSLLPVGESGDLTLRLLPGTYSITTYLHGPGSHGRDSRGTTLLGAPEIIADHDQTVWLDASKAVEVTASVPKPTEDRVLFLDWYRSDGKDSTLSGQYLLPGYDDSMFALPTTTVTQGAFEFEARWRKARKALSATENGAQVRTFVQGGAAQFSGRAGLPLVYAGNGGSDDYAGVEARGAAVLVRRTDDVTPLQRAEAAKAAGARLLVVVNDVDEPRVEFFSTDAGIDSTVPVVGVTRSTGDALIARAGVGTLQVNGNPDSPYVYDLVRPYPNRIPTTLHFAPTARELSVVNMRFYGEKKRVGGEFRWDFRPYRPSSFGLPLTQTMPATRTDYVSTQTGVQWAESAVTGPQLEWVTSSEVHRLYGGRRTTNNFFAPISRPSNGGSFWSSTRYFGYVAFNVQPWADGARGRAGYMQYADTKRLQVFQGAKRIADSQWAAATIYPVPDGRQTWRLLLTAERDPAIYTLSPRTRTEWTVHSPAISKGPDTVDLMPLLQVGYSVRTTLAGLRHGGRQAIGVTVNHLAGVVGAGKVGRPTVKVSFDDGKTWKKATVTTRRNGTSVARFTAPKRGYVTLSVSAKDSLGNRVTQRVVRAYGVALTGMGARSAGIRGARPTTPEIPGQRRPSRPRPRILTGTPSTPGEVNVLSAVGLDASEEAVYRHLVIEVDVAPAEVAAALGRDVDDVTRILERLVGTGLAGRETDTDRTARYSAAPPAVALGALLRERRDALYSAELDLAELADSHRTATMGRTPSDVVEVITDIDAVRHRFAQIQRGAQREVRSMMVPNLTVVPHAENVAGDETLRRGVRYRAILDRAALDEPGIVAAILRDIAKGEQIRVADHVPVKMMIVDETVAMLPLLAERNTAPESVLVQSGGLLSALISYFEIAWERAYPCGPTRPATTSSSCDPATSTSSTARSSRCCSPA
ncbi:MAG: S8 family serine peptidase [Candidatus Nanopelagicales bacterium]